MSKCNMSRPAVHAVMLTGLQTWTGVWCEMGARLLYNLVRSDTHADATERDRSLRTMKKSTLLTPREAAQVLGVSYPTLKQWIYKGKVRTVKTPGGHHRLPEREVDKFLYRVAERGDVSERRTNFRRISGRNQLVGRVTDIRISGLMAQVSLSIGGQRITSIITTDAVREMRLREGQTVAALIKSTEVMILRV